MNLPYRFTAFAFAAATFGLTGLAQQSSPTASGHWQGSMKAPGGQDVAIVLDLAPNAKGAWIGSFSMPDVGATDIPVDQLSVGQSKVHFVLSIAGNPVYDGTLSADGKELTGTFSTGATKSPLTLARMGVAKVKLPPPNSPLTKDFEGTWHATLNGGDAQLRLLLKLNRAADGATTGVLVNVDQGNREVPIMGIQQKDKTLEFEIRSVAVHYHGTMNAAGGNIAGEWSQMSRSTPLTFERGPFPPNSPLSKSFEGTWQAVLDPGGEIKITLGLTLTRGPDGAAVGTLKNVSEAGKELSLTTIKLQNKSVEFTVQALSASFSGTINDSGTEFSGTWIQVGTAIPLTFKRTAPPGKKP